jgi:hypothetical protein
VKPGLLHYGRILSASKNRMLTIIFGLNREAAAMLEKNDK